jgi:5-methylthioadenosine/S-adenosylhomocysteine deaminase
MIEYSVRMLERSKQQRNIMKKPLETWISNALIVTQDEKRRILYGHLQILGDRIGKITTSARSIPAGAKILNAQGLAIFPGFVQPHIHLCQTLFRNLADDLELLDWLSQRIWPFEAAHTPETLTLSAQLGIQELLASGTTCILDMGTVRHTEAICKAVAASGLRASLGKCLMDHPDTTPTYLRDTTQDALKEAEDLYANWNGACEDRIRISYAPRFVVSCTEPLLKEVAELSRQQGALIHTHSSENRKEVEWVRELVGMDNAAYLHHIGLMSERLVLAHCIWLSEQEKDLIHATGTHITHCPSSNLKLASGLAQVPQLLQKGINVGLAADGAPCNNSLNMFEEMRLAALIHKPSNGPRSMPASLVLDMATRNGAKALNWFDQIGSLESGKKADLFGVNLWGPSNMLPVSQSALPHLEQVASALVYATQSAQVAWTLVDGVVVARKGRATKISAQALSPEKVHAAQQILLKRAKEFESP